MKNVIIAMNIKAKQERVNERQINHKINGGERNNKELKSLYITLKVLNIVNPYIVAF